MMRADGTVVIGDVSGAGEDVCGEAFGVQRVEQRVVGLARMRLERPRRLALIDIEVPDVTQVIESASHPLTVDV